MSGNTKLDELIDWSLSYNQKITPTSDPYLAQRDRFLNNRLLLEAKILFIVGFTVPTFIFFLELIQGRWKFFPFVVASAVEIAILGCFTLSKTNLGYRYPHLIFLGLSWSVTCIVQIGVAFFGYLEPLPNIWNLIFLTQATTIPLLWRLHLISQLGAIFFYFSIYIGFHPTLSQPFSFYGEQGLYVILTCIICNFSVYLYERLKKDEFNAQRELEATREKTERLLLNILPESIADRLKKEPNTIADFFNEVTVLFADIVGFTELSSQISAAELVELLNQIFSMFDRLVDRHRVEKIKTIGDAYMVVAGMPDPRSDHAFAIADLALDMQDALKDFNRRNGHNFRIRIGISTGPAVAGVIGLKKFAYDLWGDTVNTASRMESHGVADSIQVCHKFYRCVKDKYLFEERGTILIKGKGEMTTYFLKQKQN